MERNENEWNVSNFILEQHRGNVMKSFYDNITIKLYFKIKSWIYRGILRVLVKKSLNLILFPLIPPNFGRIKIWDFKGIENNECSLLLKLLNKRMNFPFPLLKLSNKKVEEYYKIIIFHSILFSPPKQNLIKNHYLP